MVRWKSLQGIYRKFPAESHSKRIVKIGVICRSYDQKTKWLFFGTLCRFDGRRCI